MNKSTTSKHLYRVECSPGRGGRWKKLAAKLPDYSTFQEAEIAARPFVKHCAAVTITRANTEGINAGTFFLHRILK